MKKITIAPEVLERLAAEQLAEKLKAVGFEEIDYIEGADIYEIEKNKGYETEPDIWRLTLDVFGGHIGTGVLVTNAGQHETTTQFFDPTIEEVLILVKLLGLSPEVK